MRVRAVREKYQTCCIALLTYSKAEALYFPVQPERLRPVHHFIIIMASVAGFHKNEKHVYGHSRPKYKVRNIFK